MATDADKAAKAAISAAKLDQKIVAARLDNMSKTVKLTSSADVAIFGKEFKHTGVVIDSDPPNNNLINSKKLCVFRPEMLAFLDFQSISEAGFADSTDQNTELFNQRVTKRLQQLESAVTALGEAAALDPDNYTVAQTQYESAIASASAEIALLKVAYAFKVYAQLGPSFTSFIKFYVFDIEEFTTQTVDTGAMGETFEEYMKNTMLWSGLSTVIDSVVANGKDATLFLQFINDLAFSCAIGTPQQCLIGKRFSIDEFSGASFVDPHTQIFNIFSPRHVSEPTPALGDDKAGVIRLCRDLTASMQIGKIIAAAGDEDENLKVAMEKYVDSDYFTSTTKINPSLFKSIFGWDPYGAAVTNIDKVGSNTTLYYYVPDFRTYESGLVSTLWTLDQSTMLLSTDSDEYQTSEAVGSGASQSVPTKTFAGVKSLVDEGFASSDGIDLGLYSSGIGDLQDNLEDAASIFTQLFRLLDKRGSILSSLTVAQNSHPTSPLNFYANVVALINDRYYTKFSKFLGMNPSELTDGDGNTTTNTEEFYKCWGIHFILNYPEEAKTIVEKFVADYSKGFLTFADSSSVEEVEIITAGDPLKGMEDTTTTYEVETRDNVLPGTTTAVDLSGQRGGLYSYLQNLAPQIRQHVKTKDELEGGWSSDDMRTYVSEEGVQFPLFSPMSPTSTFCGTLNSEANQDLLAQYDMSRVMSAIQGKFDDDGDQAGDSNAYIKGVEADAKIIFAWQQASVMWTIQQDGTVWPTGIIPVAGCVIDAVFTVLYNCLSPIMEIEATADTDAWFPAVQSKSPPYNTQSFTLTDETQLWDMGLDYIAGFGSFSVVNTKYWVPVLEAIRTDLIRSEDKTMLFSGAPVGRILGGVIDAVAAAGTSSKGQTGVTMCGRPKAWGGGKIGHSGMPPSMLYASRPEELANELQIPSWSPVALSRAVGTYSLSANSLLTRGGTFGELINIGTTLAQALGGSDQTKGQNLLFGTGATNINGSQGGTGLYMFANIDNPTSATYLELLDSEYMAGEATPSQLLDQITNTVDDAAWINEFITMMKKMISEALTTTEQDDDYEAILMILTIMVMMGVGAALVGEELPFDMTDFDEAGLTEAMNAGTLTLSDLLISFDDAFVDDLIVGSTTGDNAEIPPEIWKIHNVGGTTAGNPMGSLLDTSIDMLTEASMGSTWSALIDDALPWWENDELYGASKLFNEWIVAAQTLVAARDEDIRLGIAFDILQKYGDRIATYAETAVDGLVTEEDSDPSAVEILISELAETSAGQDVLQNLTPYQLTLKQAGLARQEGDASDGYISKAELIGKPELAAIKIMLGVEKLGGDEGRNVKTSVIGIPSTLFSSVYSSELGYSGPTGTELANQSAVEANASPLYGIKVIARIPDYPIFSIVPKLFRFDYELFVLPDAFDSVAFPKSGSGSTLSWEELVKQVTFTRLRFDTAEGSPGTTEEIVKVDLEQKEIFGQLVIQSSENASLFDIYANTLASYLLEKYYKLMVGLGLGEDEFSTAGSGLEIPINDYAVDFAGALSSIYTDLESGLDSTKIDDLFMASDDIEGMSYSALTPSAASTSAISSYNAMVSSFSTEIAAGEFSEVESSLFESFTNAASSRLFSAEAMRDKILGAKYFDRVVYILVDPDEFDIAAVGTYQMELERGRLPSLGQGEKTVIQTYRGYQNLLLQSGDLEATESDASGNPEKLKIRRRLDEGHLSFSSLYFVVIRDLEKPDKTAYGVVMAEDEPGDQMIDDEIDIGAM